MRTLLLLLAVTVSYVSCQMTPTGEENIGFVCNAQTSCQDCIRANPMCVWCTAANFTSNRCYQMGAPNAPQCDTMSLQNPRGGSTFVMNVPFSDSVQIAPQRVSVNLRPGEPVSFRLGVRPAPNFPLDLYLLMDLSASMNDDLANLKNLGESIANTIRTITTDFTIGFGSFVDKVLSPFVNVWPVRLNDPCSSRVCDSPYSYLHSITLTPDSDSFNTVVQGLRTSGNQDGPEGGLDGFLQAIVCQDVIGWRQNTRRLLLYISDAGFHLAGDGKLAGVIRPHPGVCLMNSTERGPRGVNYTDYDKYDYPSIGQINEKLREFDIIPILAVTAGPNQTYQALARELTGATIGELASNSANVVQLIENAYRTVSQRIIASPDFVPEVAFNITPTDSCPSIDSDGNCAGLQIGDTAEINMELTLAQCTDRLVASPLEIPVRILGFGTLMIQVNGICDCQCQANVTMNSETCNNNGTLTCGICECNPGRFGENCQCDNSGMVAGSTNTTECPRGSNNLECSGTNRGQCVCGQCQCRQFQDGMEFFGDACQCDNFQCDRDRSNRVCGGPERGMCTCDGTCQCLPSSISGRPYTGSACDCSPDNNTCIDPNTPGRQCNGNGNCTCGDCTCNEGYAGQYCEICTISSICQRLICNDNTNCAMCAKNVSTINCTQCRYELIGQVTDPNNYRINGNTAAFCEFLDDEACRHQFFVAVDRQGVTQPVHAVRERICPAAVVAPWIPAVSIIAALLLLGILALIIIKIILVILDFFELKKFMKSVQDPKFRKNENPLFQAPTKEYKNPIYGE